MPACFFTDTLFGLVTVMNILIRIVATRPQVLGEEAIIKLSNPSAIVNASAIGHTSTWQCIPFNASIAIPLPSQANRFSAMPPIPAPLACQFPSFQSLCPQAPPIYQNNEVAATDPSPAATTKESDANGSSWVMEDSGEDEMDPSAAKGTPAAEDNDDCEGRSFSNADSCNSDTDEDPDPASDEFETPPQSVVDAAIVRKSPRNNKGGSSSIGIQDDYRRFSARSKKKTNFFGVSHHHHHPNRYGRGAGKAPRGNMPAKRSLRFDKKNDLLLVNKVSRPAVQNFVPPPLSREGSSSGLEEKLSNVSG